MGYYSGKDFPEMLADLATAEKSTQTGTDLTNWVTQFASQTGQRKNNVGGAVAGLRADWQDLAGNSFETRWTMAAASVDPWARWALPPELAQLGQKVADTRRIVDQAKADYNQAMRQLAIPTNPNSSFAEKMQAAEPGFLDGALIGAEAAKARAAAAMDSLSEFFTTLGQQTLESIPNSPWNGPTGDAGIVPQTAPDQRPTSAGPGTGPGVGPSASDLANTGDQAADQANQADQAQQTSPADGAAAAEDAATGGNPTGGNLPTDDGGTGLAGLPGTTTPTTPTYPTGPGNLGKLPTPTPSLPIMPPGGIPYLPLTTTTPKDFKGLKAGTGLGGSGLGGSGLGGSGLGGSGLGGGGKSRLGGLDLGRGISENGTNGPAQAARQMPSRPLAAIPEAPVPPTAAPAGSAAAPATGGTPPPMMPPMGMGAGGGSPRPGTAKPVVQNKGRTTDRLPGVPPKLRGRSGKADPTSGLGAFGAAATATTRRQSERKEQIDTLQILDEELWAVDSTPESSTTAKRKGLGSR